MSLLGIDVGTTGCKAIVFSVEGEILASAYEEYDVLRIQSGYAELDSEYVWQKVKTVIRAVALATKEDPIQALTISSLGEAVVPVTNERRILGPSLLNFDQRGEEFLDQLGEDINSEYLYRINGNTLGNHYSLTKLLWIKKHQPELYDQTDLFLHWSGFISYMLGAEPTVDYSLANRTLLFDIDGACWSDELLHRTHFAPGKLPPLVPAGSMIGEVSSAVAKEIGLPESVVIVAGAHDQCVNALGSGVIQEGQAMYGMGTYLCITPVFQQRKDPVKMLARGLNTEHHVVPGLYASFIYNLGGALFKWYRDTFAPIEKQRAQEAGKDIYSELIAEIPEQPSDVLVLPHFAPTGPPEFITDSSGVMIGLKLDTHRGDILKGILEGTTYYLRECVDMLPATGISIQDYRVVGGGSKSDAWIQMCADIMGKPFHRPAITEAGALGAAILAGVGSNIFPDFAIGVQTMVKSGQVFDPNPTQMERYTERYQQYQLIWPMLKNNLAKGM